MKWDNWRRSDNVEDYRDPNRPVSSADPILGVSVMQQIALSNSSMAQALGSTEVITPAGESS